MLSNHHLKMILIISSFGFSFSAYANCNYGNVYESLNCLETKNKSLKKRINTEYSKLMKVSSLRKPVDESQKAWLAYRNSQCQDLIGEISSTSLGAGSALSVLSCEVELNQLRLTQLTEASR